MIRLVLALPFLALQLAVATAAISDADALKIGKKIWQNECAGTVEGLTSWNSGEDFASVGIGHFIWYHGKHRGPFEESFPKLAAYLAHNGVDVPQWMRGPCPWTSRSQFLADASSARMKELRSLLASTIALQARFCAQRLEQALPKMLEAAPKKDRDRIRANFQRVAAQPMGMYALIDYVNFKGEGTNPSERYNGQGWGLLQVLEAMKDGPPLAAFSKAADEVLTRRVANSPKARNEAKWLPGWRNRVKTYAN
jgi:hypothetical protein